MTPKLPTNWVNGFMVVRKPTLNRDAAARGAFSDHTPCREALCYAGIDRMPWFDIDDLWYAGSLPEPWLSARKQLRSDNSDITGLELSQDLNVAISLLTYSNRANAANELIAVRSEALLPAKGIVATGPLAIAWLGYDVVALGQQSLLRDGLFAVPSAFPSWWERINDSGLLPSLALVEGYTIAYRAASSRGEVEEILSWEEDPLGSADSVLAIEVGRVLVADEPAADQLT